MPCRSTSQALALRGKSSVEQSHRQPPACRVYLAGSQKVQEGWAVIGCAGDVRGVVDDHEGPVQVDRVGHSLQSCILDDGTGYIKQQTKRGR